MKLRILLISMFVCSIAAAQAAEQQDVSFENDGLTISGTLNLPAGKGPFPAAVLIHGSGPNDRHQTVILNDPNAKCLYPDLFGDTIAVFDDLADALTKAGMAVYQYEKRSREHAATLDQTTVTPTDFLRDAVAAAAMLRGREDIDGAKLVLIGHSQGANFVHAASDSLGGAAAVVMLSGPAKPIDEVVMTQIDTILRRCASAEAADQTVAQMRGAFEQLHAGTFPQAPLMGAFPQFWRDWIEMTGNAVPTVAKTKVPTLIMCGLQDINVGPENIAMFEQVKNDKVKVVRFPDLNHMLTTGSEPRVAAELTDTMVKWLREVGAL